MPVFPTNFPVSPWAWIAFHVVVFTILAFDLGVLSRKFSVSTVKLARGFDGVKMVCRFLTRTHVPTPLSLGVIVLRLSILLSILKPTETEI